MSNLMKHKGFSGSCEFDFKKGILYGKIECINDLVTYEATDVAGFKAAFEEAVDDYIESCQNLGKRPDKPMNGSFNIRIGEELHKKVYLKSLEKGCSINDVIKQFVGFYIKGGRMAAGLKVVGNFYLNMNHIKSVEDSDTEMVISFSDPTSFLRIYVGDNISTSVQYSSDVTVEVNEYHRIKRQIHEFLGIE